MNGLKFLLSDLLFLILKGKGASVGVGRGRAVAMRAKVSVISTKSYVVPFLRAYKVIS